MTAYEERFLYRPAGLFDRSLGHHRHRGRHRTGAAAHRPVSQDRPARGEGERLLSGRQRPDRDAGGGHADRTGAQRYAGDALHGVVVDQLRRLHRHDHLRHRHRCRPGGRRGAEPREAGRKPAAGRGGAERHLGRETGVEQTADDHAAVVGSQVRRNLPEQLRDAQRAGHAAARAGRGQRLERRIALLRHADLGAARPAGQSGADGAGLAAGIEGSEPRIGRRRARAAAHDRSRCDDPHYGAGAFVVGGRVRGDRRPRQPRRLDHPPARRGARFARSVVL